MWCRVDELNIEPPPIFLWNRLEGDWQGHTAIVSLTYPAEL